MELREPNSGDLGRIREMVESAMTTSYALSPQQIETIVEDQFGEEHLTGTDDHSDTVVFVAENGEDEGAETIAGLVVGRSGEHTGEVDWLLVDPEHRGNGIGTQLFETMIETLRDRGVERVQANALQANTDGEKFFERFEYERTDERRVEIGDESLVEYVYTEPSVASTTATSAKTDTGDVDLPATEVHDGVVTATTEDDQQVYIDRDRDESGTEDSFLPVYVDEEYTDQFGYYCANCGSLDVSVDNMDRMECGQCGNAHASRSSEAYDDSYL